MPLAVVQIQTAGLVARPWDVVMRQESLEAFLPKRASFVNAVIGIDLRDQLILDVGPILSIFYRVSPILELPTQIG
jgi:hypothetical protein